MYIGRDTVSPIITPPIDRASSPCLTRISAFFSNASWGLTKTFHRAYLIKWDPYDLLIVEFLHGLTIFTQVVYIAIFLNLTFLAFVVSANKTVAAFDIIHTFDVLS